VIIIAKKQYISLNERADEFSVEIQTIKPAQTIT
jgi:hypothetical protein